MTGPLTPPEVKALGLLRADAPHEFVAVVCSLPVERVREIGSRRKSYGRQACRTIRDAKVSRQKGQFPKMCRVQYEEVDPYECPVCERRTYLSPCVACAARGRRGDNASEGD